MTSSSPAQKQQIEERGASWFLSRPARRPPARSPPAPPVTLLGKQVQCAQCHDHPVAPEIEQAPLLGPRRLLQPQPQREDSRRPPRRRTRPAAATTKFANLEGKADPVPAHPLLQQNQSPNPAAKRTKDSEELYQTVSPPEQWFRKLKKDEKLKKDLPALPYT